VSLFQLEGEATPEVSLFQPEGKAIPEASLFQPEGGKVQIQISVILSSTIEAI